MASGLLQFLAKETSSSKDLDKRLRAAQPPREPEQGKALLLYLGLLRTFLCWMGERNPAQAAPATWTSPNCPRQPSFSAPDRLLGPFKPPPGNTDAAAFLGVILKRRQVMSGSIFWPLLCARVHFHRRSDFFPASPVSLCPSSLLATGKSN